MRHPDDTAPPEDVGTWEPDLHHRRGRTSVAPRRQRASSKLTDVRMAPFCSQHAPCYVSTGSDVKLRGRAHEPVTKGERDAILGRPGLEG